MNILFTTRETRSLSDGFSARQLSQVPAEVTVSHFAYFTAQILKKVNAWLKTNFLKSVVINYFRCWS